MNIKSIVDQEIKSYARKGVNGQVVFAKNDSGDEFVLIAHGKLDGNTFTFTSLSAAVIDDSVVIYEDRNDPSLTESLIQAGIPREKIILAYAGECAPVEA